MARNASTCPLFVNKIKIHTGSHAIALGIVKLIGFLLVGKGLGAVKEMGIAWRYGTSEIVDSYGLAMSFLTWPIAIWSSVLTSVLVPKVIQIKNDFPDDLHLLWSELLALCVALGTMLFVLVEIGLPYFLASRWTGVLEAEYPSLRNYTTVLALAIPIGFVISLLSAWTIAEGKHRNTLFEAIPALIVVLFLFLPERVTPSPLLWGSVIGLAFQAVALYTPLRSNPLPWKPTFSFKSIVWEGFFGGILLVTLGQALMSACTVVDQYFAARIGQAAISTLGYANRLLSLFLGVGAVAIARASLPVFSELGQSDIKLANRIALKWSYLTLGMGSVLMLLGWILAPFIVGKLFVRGAFTVADCHRVSEVLRYALLQVPFYAFTVTLATFYASQKRYHIILMSGILGLMAKLIAANILVPEYGLQGVVLSSTAVYLANALYFYHNTTIKSA
jgi:putative peptidoglycan lipid II flippase